MPEAINSERAADASPIISSGELPGMRCERSAWTSYRKDSSKAAKATRNSISWAVIQALQLPTVRATGIFVIHDTMDRAAEAVNPKRLYVDRVPGASCARRAGFCDCLRACRHSMLCTRQHDRHCHCTLFRLRRVSRSRPILYRRFAKSGAAVAKRQVIMRGLAPCGWGRPRPFMAPCPAVTAPSSPRPPPARCRSPCRPRARPGRARRRPRPPPRRAAPAGCAPP